ncbi:hypothetical protein PMKS-003912 [Pichia membranifaciens]|uniref:Uncharacterized protein n=1 Tax=Pichia membranifaciens TaxID=4926 RepID=A0A1Q2YLN8_9ASCO|nr:hypothetical protein PMKS-003912 [Pichia membranifaciens]
MYYVGIDTDRKFNVPGYWPDPDTLNKIPKEPHEIQAELARIRQAKIEKRRRLEEKAKLLGITPDDDDKDEAEASDSTQDAVEAVLATDEYIEEITAHKSAANGNEEENDDWWDDNFYDDDEEEEDEEDDDDVDDDVDMTDKDDTNI